ncbi:MAG: polyprenyl synthetase family protein [Planctomycetes bacterium]|nr:polyprenyl synthetase family protein [Planctomycetota bacterium]
MEHYLTKKQRLVNQALNEYLPTAKTFPPLIHKAIRYSVLNGGKRLRAILALMAGELFGTAHNKIMPYACALEMVHAYSLIHDDLPAMDNDDFRRGKPTSHKVFGEAMAILAGDALLTYSFQLIADKIQNESIVPKLVSELARAAGSVGMVGGQVLDIQHSKPKVLSSKLLMLKETHLRKTGAMIIASARGGAIISGASTNQLSAITFYARNFGLAFQIVDDILDVSGSKKQLGKTPGKDAKLNKLTYPALKGLKPSRQEAEHLITQANDSLKIFGKRAAKLKELTDYLLKRKT